LVKGGKWVFGWVVVGPQGALVIPPAAWDEYGFQVGDEVTFIAGSRRSGGFGLSHPRLLDEAAMPTAIPLASTRALARGRIDEAGRVVVPAAVGVRPGARQLAGRGRGLALGFVARGPIYEEALRYPGTLEQFGVNM
jgi:hypothetical protein